MKSLGESMKGWAPTGVNPGDPLPVIGSRWTAVVGEANAANSRPVKLERGVLTVTTRSSGHSHELTFLAERILAELTAIVPEAKVERLVFKVGRLTEPRASGIGQAGARERGTRRTPRPPSVDTAEAIARFRSDVEAYRRAKEAAGWKPCSRCGVPIAPGAGSACGVCADVKIGERTSAVMRLLYDAPLISYERVSEFVPDLDRKEYGAIRSRLLKRWWSVLQRALRAGKLSRDGSERAIAQSYVMLKSGMTADRLAPATVRNELGDELYVLLYEKRN